MQIFVEWMSGGGHEYSKMMVHMCKHSRANNKFQVVGYFEISILLGNWKTCIYLITKPQVV